MKTRTGYLVKRGNNFYAAWNIGKKKFMKTTGCTTEREAKKVLSRMMQPYLIQDSKKTLNSVKAWLEGADAELAAMDPPLKVADAWQAYLKSTNRPDSGPSTLEQYSFQFARFEDWLSKTHPTAKTLQSVTPEIADAYAADLIQNGRSGNTFNKYMNLLALVFRVLAKTARITVNPWNDIQRKKTVSQGRRELTIEELKKVCDAAKGEMRLLFAIGIYTGLRLGDACTLRWGEVDILRGVITRIPNKTGRRNAKPVQIPIHASLLALLAAIPSRGRGVYVVPEIAAAYLSRIDHVTEQIQRHFSDCDIITHKPGTGFITTRDEEGKEIKKHTGTRAVIEVGFHSLRHTFVSLCRAANTPLSVVEAIVGHSNPAMTRHYTHTGIDAATVAVSALPSFTGDQKALPPAAGSRPLVDAEAVQSIGEAMTVRNWQTKRDELFDLVKQAGKAGAA